MVEMALGNVRKKYDNAEHYSVTDFNLEITGHEFIIFVGPSGCSKSAVLRIIAGLKDITEDELSIGDKVMNDVTPKDRDITMAFQNYALYPYMTVFGNVAFGLELRKYDKAEIKKRVENTTDILDLAEYSQYKPVALSDGRHQRAVLGRAIVHDARVSLMDEPLSNLDVKLRVAMHAEIAKLHQRLETTTVYVTHDQTETMTMADRIVTMKDGFIQQISLPEEVYDTPKNMSAVGFISSPAMNFFKVTLSDGVISNQHDLELAIPGGRNKELAEHGYEDKELTFGVHPEGVYSEQVVLAAMKGAVVKSEVAVSELSGAESMLYTKISNAEPISKVGARDFHHPGGTIDSAFNINKGRFFDPQTGKVIK